MHAELASLKRLRVLLVAADVHLALLTIRYLETHGIEVVVALRGSDTLAHVLRWSPDVMMLAATLPDACGYEICRSVRQRFDVPIIMIAELPDGADRVEGLEAGADDCVTKPFSTRELLARVHVHARRALRRLNSSPDRLQIGELRIDLPSRKAFVSGRDVGRTCCLDLMLPGVDGLEVCRRIRERLDVPIIMVTARTEEADRVLGLEGGADDYVSKPFSSRELLARIRAHARRARGSSGPAPSRLELGALCVDTETMSATLRGRRLSLTSYEFSLLRVLAERSGRVLNRESLLELLQGSAEGAFDRSIDVHVSRLRQKLEDDPKNPRYLKTIRGAGYVLVADED